MSDDTEKVDEVESEVTADEVATDEVVAEESSVEEVVTEEVAAEVVESEPVSEEPVASDADSSEAEEAEPRPARVRTGPIEEIIEEETDGSDQPKQWYILKVQVNREDSIRDALARRVKIEGLDEFFGDIIVPTEDVVEFTKSGKRKVVKRKLYPGYILVHMVINDDSWFLVRETPGIGDFTGSAGKPTPMEMHEVERILQLTNPVVEDEDDKPRVNIPFVVGDRVRVKEGNFENFEGAVDGLDESNGRVIVMINIFGRQVPAEFEHWQIEKV